MLSRTERRNSNVWEFIREYKIPYCKLYDEGYKRLGCIGCPMNPQQQQGLDRYPKYKQAYLKAFDRMLARYNEEDKEKKHSWKTADDVMEWWING